MPETLEMLRAPFPPRYPRSPRSCCSLAFHVATSSLTERGHGGMGARLFQRALSLPYGVSSVTVAGYQQSP